MNGVLAEHCGGYMHIEIYTDVMHKQSSGVTGGNRGIGLEICRQLAQQHITIILTARSLVKAEQAAANLQSKGANLCTAIG